MTATLTRLTERTAGSGNRHAPPANALGARLRMLRKHAHLHQRDLHPVQDAGRVSDHELGFVIPSLRVLQKYAAFYGMTVAQLLDGVL